MGLTGGIQDSIREHLSPNKNPMKISFCATVSNVSPVLIFF
uniref:Uncharacterized protein n=1 Tax=Arundo donax TaxID=35708 RepID=A0A0A9FL39_ARUDO